MNYTFTARFPLRWFDEGCPKRPKGGRRYPARQGVEAV